MTANFWAGAEVIHTYTRADAIRDGALIDVSELAREAGILWPVAITAAAHADTVVWTDTDEKRKGFTGQDENGRLWDVLNMTRHAISAFNRRRPRSAATIGDRIVVRLVRVPREGRGTMPRKVELHAHYGPGDDGKPVITLMLPSED